MRLEPSTINELVELLRPFMEDERNRRPFLILALGNDAPVLQHITWSGSVATFIPDMVCKLADYGEVAPGRQALWALLEYVRSQAGVDVQQRINKLRPLIDLRSQSSTPTDTSSGVETPNIDVLVQKVRSLLHDKIQRMHGTMQLLDVARPVEIDRLYVDVNILTEPTSYTHLEINDLLSGHDYRRDFNRFGLPEQGERVAGLKAVLDYPKLMVLGKPGSGKTTFLQHVAIECNNGNLLADRVPILIKLREFVKEARKIGNFSLQRYICQELQSCSQQEIEVLLQEGKLLMLLDGLDEVCNADSDEVVDQVKWLVHNYDQNHLIITCRIQAQKYIFERFVYAEVADFNSDQIAKLARKWFVATARNGEQEGQAKAGQFIETLNLPENQQILDLAVTPILLSLTCKVFSAKSKFYSKPAELYKQGLNLLLFQWDERRRIARDKVYRDLSVTRKQELLSYLAARKFEQEQYLLFEQDEIQGYVADFLGISSEDSQAVIESIEAQHGLLVERSQRIYSFSHLTFQEYFVAKWFFDKSDFEGLFCHITKPRYREIFLVSCMIWNVNKLLPLMKKKVDKILALDSSLQQFLSWISRKSGSSHSSDKPAAIRAFYYPLVSTIADWLDLMRSRIIYLKIYPNVEIAHYLFNGLYYALEYPIHIERLKKIDRTLNDSSARDRPIDYRLTVEYQYELNVEYQRSLALAIDSSIEHISTIEFDSDLFKLLQAIKDKIFDTKGDSKNFIIWWDFNSKSLLKELENAINCYFEIYQKWSLTKEQEKLLQQYYTANKLLVDCINSSYSISDKIRQEIKDTLLLPIAEIENYSSIEDNFG